MNLVIDIGNNRTKVGIFEKDKMIDSWKQFQNMPPLFRNRLKKYPDLKKAILSSVKKEEKTFTNFLKKRFSLLVFNTSTPLRVKNKYATPETLGSDRLANAAAAAAFFPGKHVLIVDAGTCLKFDFIDKKNNYLGGAISPGLRMRYNALNHFTDKLPLIEPSAKFALTGNDTRQSILSGVQNGMIFEINGMIKQYRRKYKDLKIILTGGDHPFFADHLKSSIFAAPHLTLWGLNEILKYNVRKRS
jgi:type III pantothenate kinase